MRLTLPLLLASLLSSTLCFAVDKTATKNIPLLGPGSDKLSTDEYVKVYRNYIQQSILLGYPFLEEAPEACDQALRTIFRQAGFFMYPVPAALDRSERANKTNATQKIEAYQLGGQLIQVERDAKNSALKRLVWINSASPKASKLLWGAAKLNMLQLVRDPITGLERLQNLPVGYPHPFLDKSSQGLFVRELLFNGKNDGCMPLSYTDNSWTGGYVLGQERCNGLRQTIMQVWGGKSKTSDLAEQERSYLREAAMKNAVSRGQNREAAEKLIAQTLVPPLTHDLTLVGGAMRNLAECNILAIGGKATLPPPSTPQPASGADSAK